MIDGNLYRAEPLGQANSRPRNSRRGVRPVGFHRQDCRRRNEAERTTNRLKAFRAVATRYHQRAYILHGTTTPARHPTRTRTPTPTWTKIPQPLPSRRTRNGARQLRAASVEQRIHAKYSETRLQLAGLHAVAEDFGRDAIPNAAASMKLQWSKDLPMTVEVLDEIAERLQAGWAVQARGFEREAEGYRDQLADHAEAFPPQEFIELVADRRKFAGATLEDLADGRTTLEKPDAVAAHAQPLALRSAALLNPDPISHEQGSDVEPDGGADGNVKGPADRGLSAGAGAEWSVGGRDVNRIPGEADTAVAGIDASLARAGKRQAASESSAVDRGARKTGNASGRQSEGPPVERSRLQAAAVGL